MESIGASPVLLYIGIVLLKRKSTLCTQRYYHFLKFSIVMRYLLQPNANRDILTFCHKLLCEFVNDSVALYGKRFVSYNVHSVVHIVDDYWHFGCLEMLSAFVFESYLGLLKYCVRSGYKSLQQVCKIQHVYHQNRMCSFITNRSSSFSKSQNTPASEIGSSQLAVDKIKLPNSTCYVKN